MFDKVLYPNESLRAIDKLRAAGVDRYVDLPRLLVFGGPSTNSIDLLKDLCGVSFPPQSSCDQFFLEVNIRPSKPLIGEPVAEITITPSAARSAQEVEALEAFKRTFPLREPDLARFLDDARRALGLAVDDREPDWARLLNDAKRALDDVGRALGLTVGDKSPEYDWTSTKTHRLKDVIRLDILGPGLPFVSLMHLPEMRLRSGNCTKFRCYERLQFQYMKSPQSYLIPVLSTTGKRSDQYLLLLLAARADPSKKRVQPAVIASAEWAQEFRISTSSVPTETPLRIGWERRFRLHSLSCLPDIRENVQRHVSDTRIKIEALNDIHGLRSSLLTASERFSDLTRQAIDGTYCDYMFDWMNCSSVEFYQLHLHVVLRGVFAMFERTMKTNSRRGRPAVNVRDRLDRPPYLRDRPSLVPTPVKRHDTAASGPERRGGVWLEETVAQPSPTKPGDGWDLIVHDTLTEVSQAIRSTTRQIIRCVVEPSDSGKVMRNIVFPRLEVLENHLREEVDGLLARHNACRQATRHSHRANKVRDTQRAGKMDLESHFGAAFGPNVLSNPPKNITVDSSRIFELFANIGAYADGKLGDCAQVQLDAEDEMSLQSFISDVRVLMFETALPKMLPTIFPASAIATMSDEELCRLMECPALLDADHDMARKRRKALERSEAALEDFLKLTEPEVQTDFSSEDMYTPSASSCGYDSESVSTSTVMYTPEESVIGT